jgi:hypothetical protein
MRQDLSAKPCSHSHGPSAPTRRPRHVTTDFPLSLAAAAAAPVLTADVPGLVVLRYSKLFKKFCSTRVMLRRTRRTPEYR